MNAKQQITVLHGSMLHIPPTNLLLLAGQKEIFINRYTVERINKADIRPEEQSEKAENCRENLWNETQLKGP